MSTLPAQKSKTLVVTGGAPGEGKTTTAANLAISFAHAEKKVLLVDADMRRPAVHTMFALSREPGLMEILTGANGHEPAIHHEVLRNLDVICCGKVPRNPAEILGSTRMVEFIATMSSRYDLILFDTPPVLAATDAVILSRIADGVIFVLSSGQTRRGILDRSVEALKKVSANLLGVVLNNFDVGQAYGRKYESYAYGYGYGTELCRKEEGQNKTTTIDGIANGIKTDPLDSP